MQPSYFFWDIDLSTTNQLEDSINVFSSCFPHSLYNRFFSSFCSLLNLTFFTVLILANFFSLPRFGFILIYYGLPTLLVCTTSIHILCFHSILPRSKSGSYYRTAGQVYTPQSCIFLFLLNAAFFSPFRSLLLLLHSASIFSTVPYKLCSRTH